MKINRVCLVGGSGFVGRHLVARLAARGIRCRVLSRHPQRHAGLRTAIGSELRAVDVFDKASLQGAITGCQAVVNLVGILNERRPHDFRRLHVELVDNLVEATRAAGARRLLHMSALNADEAAGASLYLRTKGAGENRAHTLGQPDIAVTSFRPSVIFGPDDSFINRFATLLRLPGPLPLACPGARLAPVYVEDVAEAFCRALEDPAAFGRHYELCGPREYSLREIVEYLAGILGLHKEVIPLPDWAARLQARILGQLPGRPFTMDNYLSLQVPSVCREAGLAALGITPTHLEAVVPAMLAAETPRGRLDRLRRQVQSP